MDRERGRGKEGRGKREWKEVRGKRERDKGRHGEGGRELGRG